jgi:nitrogen fixation protein NifB
MQCNFCNRKYDCVNESRPGVTSTILNPQQALAYLTHTLAQRPEITVMGIAGPGDPFANPEETMETLRLARAHFPELILCVATNGLGIGPYIEELARLRVSHVTITINVADPEIGAEIYAWVRDDKRPLRGRVAAETLLTRQLDALVRLKAHGIVVKINSIIIPGVNDEHIPEVARTVAELGADVMNCMPLVPVQGSEFEDLSSPDGMMTARTRLAAGLHLPQMSHCARCRADAVGLIAEKMGAAQIDNLQHYANMTATPEQSSQRPYVAAASLEGALVNQHLGEAERLLIYEQNPELPGTFRLVEIRRASEEGSGDARWEELARILKDCRVLLVAAAGPNPRKILSANGLEVIEMDGLIEEGLRAIYANQPIPAALKRRFAGCGAGMNCKGTGAGCG